MIGDQVTSFTRMDQGTAKDWARITHETDAAQPAVRERVVALLRSLEVVENGFSVNQLVHCLQTATRAERAGADRELVVAALCHDVGKQFVIGNHGAMAAELLAPYVREEVAWVIRHHQDFQGRYYYHFIGGDSGARDKHRGHPAFQLATTFGDDWDQLSFDPTYDTLPLDHFVPLVGEIFGARRYGE